MTMGGEEPRGNGPPSSRTDCRSRPQYFRCSGKMRGEGRVGAQAGVPALLNREIRCWERGEGRMGAQAGVPALLNREIRCWERGEGRMGAQAGVPALLNREIRCWERGEERVGAQARVPALLGRVAALSWSKANASRMSCCGTSE